jgi:hypothetical protein
MDIAKITITIINYITVIIYPLKVRCSIKPTIKLNQIFYKLINIDEVTKSIVYYEELKT